MEMTPDQQRQGGKGFVLLVVGLALLISPVYNLSGDLTPWLQVVGLAVVVAAIVSNIRFALRDRAP